MNLIDLIAALSKSDAYPFPVGQVEVHQTHISVVFLAGEYAYKIKKPVQLGFLDFFTLENRRHFCEEEVRLNRRLAPKVYLGVVPVAFVDQKKGSGFSLVFEGAGEVIEWAVKMKRLPQDATLQQRILRGKISSDVIEALAKKIAHFHKTANNDKNIAEFGRFEVVSRNARENFEQAQSQIGITLSKAVWHRLQELTDQQLQTLGPTIENRAERGLTRDTHGDLHLDHVYLFPEENPPDDLVIVDCIEFNERFRFADPVSDMAFLVMDLSFHHRRDLARSFADAYFQASGDEEGRSLLPFYVAYRAAVRAKVGGMELAEKEVPHEEKQIALKEARAHWLLALGELEQPNRKPCLILIGGLPGTGKSTLAAKLMEMANLTVIRSDEVRKELAGLAPNETGPAELYTAEWSDRTYSECLHRAEALLFQGKRILVDANFWDETKRQLFLQTAAAWGVPKAFFLCQAETELVRDRLQGRHEDVSDADWAIHRQVADKWQEIGAKTIPYLHIIRSNTKANAAEVAAVKRLVALHLA